MLSINSLPTIFIVSNEKGHRVYEHDILPENELPQDRAQLFIDHEIPKYLPEGLTLVYQGYLYKANKAWYSDDMKERTIRLRPTPKYVTYVLVEAPDKKEMRVYHNSITSANFVGMLGNITHSYIPEAKDLTDNYNILLYDTLFKVVDATTITDQLILTLVPESADLSSGEAFRWDHLAGEAGEDIE